MSRANELAKRLRGANGTMTTSDWHHINSAADELERLARVNAELEKWKAAAKALHFAYTPDEHASPSECFATGPRTGDPIADYIACPGCAAQLAWDAALNTPSGDHL